MGASPYRQRLEAYEVIEGVATPMTFKCPNCGAPSRGYQMEKCRYCDSVVDYAAMAMARYYSVPKPMSVTLIRELKRQS